MDTNGYGRVLNRHKRGKPRKSKLTIIAGRLAAPIVFGLIGLAVMVALHYGGLL